MRPSRYFCAGDRRMTVASLVGAWPATNDRRLPLNHRIAGTFLVALLSMSAAIGQLPVIGLRSLSQSFYVPGQSYEVSVADGSNTEEVRELVFSHPGITATLLDADPKPFSTTRVNRHGNFRVSLSNDVPAGRYEVRAVGRFGISNPRSVIVGHDIQVTPSSGSDAAGAVPLAVGMTHCGRASPQKRDFYSMQVVAGRAYTIRLITQAVDSQLIGAVSLINESGQTIHSSIGSDHSDVRLTWTAAETGTLTVAVHDALFRGGVAYPYGLRLSEGHDSPSYLRTELPDAISLIDQTAVSVDEAESPVSLEVPSSVEAAFDSPDDTDQYVCKLSKNAPVRIEVSSDRIGEPTDVRMIIDRAVVDGQGNQSWQQVATAEDSHNVSDSVIRLASDDPVLRFQPPEDGDYRITVTDLDTGRSLGDVQKYRLTIGAPTDDWQLLAYHVYPNKDPKTSRPSGTHLMRGGAMTVRVFVIRNQMSAPIKLSIPDLPDGLNCRPGWIAANQNQADLVIEASDKSTTLWGSVQVVGEASRNSQPESRIARVATVVWEQDGYRPTTHARLTDRLMIASSESDVYPVSVRPRSADIVQVTKGNKVTVPLNIERREGGKESVVLRARNLPGGVKVGDLTIAKDKTEAEWTVDVTAGTQPGTYTFWGQGETKVKFAVNPQALTRATANRDELKALRADESRSAEHAEIDKAIVEADKQIESLKKQTAAKDFTVYLATPLITLEVQ